MLDHLHQRAIEVLTPVNVATLSTYGLAGIQAEVLPCEARGTTLYLLVPSGSEHLTNLEQDPLVVVTADDWQMRGAGRLVPPAGAPFGLELLASPRSAGCVLVAVRPRRLQIGRASGWGFSETIDFPADETEPDSEP